jgi:sigma-54-specific transcriptional regulator
VALLIASGNVIRPENLRFSAMPLPLGADNGHNKTPLETISAQLDRLFLSPPPELYLQLEEILFKRAFNYCSGNQVQTAKMLGISRNILRTQLKHFGLIGSDAGDTEPSDTAVGTIA